MSTVASDLHALQPARMRSFVLPREHGAWGILAIPLITGGWIGQKAGEGVGSLVLFAVAALALFCLRTPVEVWLKTSPLRAQTLAERRAVFYSILAYSSLAGLALGYLLWKEHAYGLLLLGAAVAATFVAQAVLRKLGRRYRTTAQLIGALGLTSTAAGAYYVVTGRFESSAFMLWGVNWLFAANQILFVQLRIHNARAATCEQRLACGWRFLIAESLTLAALVLAWQVGSLPGAPVLAFGPVLTRGLLWFLRPSPPLGVHRLGWTELTHALVFGALLILAFEVPIA